MNEILFLYTYNDSSWKRVARKDGWVGGGAKNGIGLQETLPCQKSHKTAGGSSWNNNHQTSLTQVKSL